MAAGTGLSFSAMFPRLVLPAQAHKSTMIHGSTEREMSVSQERPSSICFVGNPAKRMPACMDGTGCMEHPGEHSCR